MKKKQGSLKIETAEGVESLEIQLTSEMLDLPIMIAALKQKLKDYGMTKLQNRPLILQIHIGPPADPDEVPEKVRKRNAERYPDSPPGEAPKLA